MLASEYARTLLAAVEAHGDFPVCVTQNGYYADGAFADWYDPSVPQMVEVSDRGVIKQEGPYYVLGHSSQNY